MLIINNDTLIIASVAEVIAVLQILPRKQCRLFSGMRQGQLRKDEQFAQGQSGCQGAPNIG